MRLQKPFTSTSTSNVNVYVDVLVDKHIRASGRIRGGGRKITIGSKNEGSGLSLSTHSTFSKKSGKKVVGSESDCPPVLRVLSRRSGRTAALPYPPPKSGHYITEEPSAEKGQDLVYYCGIDLHSDNNVLGVIDSTGNRLSIKRNSNDLEAVKKALEPFAANLEGIVVESTYNWYWLVDGLQESGYKLHLANPAAIEQYSGLKHSDDETDTWWLAELLRLKLLKEGYVYPRSERAVRDLLRKRGQLVRMRTQNILSIQNLTCRNTGDRLSGNQVKQLTVEEVKELYKEEAERGLAVICSINVIKALEKQIETIEKKVKSKIKLSQPFQLLNTINGIGEILAMVIMLEAGDMSRFPSVGNFSSYCRCVKSVRLSNNKKKGNGNRKNGNKYLAWAFMEAANYAIRYKPIIAKFYQRKSSKKGSVVARKAVAHKLARATYYVLRDQTPFDVERCFGC
jgi:transposase